MSHYTPVDEIEPIYSTLDKGFRSGKTKSIAYRKQQLVNLGYLVKDNAERFQEAFKADLGRPVLENSFLELDSTITEIKQAISGVDKWAKTERPPFSLTWSPMRPAIRKEPKGVCLIIVPFNYPLWLAMSPLAGAIAAGNAVVLKPSELTPAIGVLLAELFPKYMDPELYRVVNGAIPETSKLLELSWGHILYTGSGRVAKIVAAAAAKTLTPVSLELGGKSPVVVDSKCDLASGVKRLLWGKVANAGQTCVAPDYVLVQKDFQDTFINALTEAYNSFYPEGPAQSDSVSHIISTGHTERIKRLIDNTQGTVVLGGQVDIETKFVAPTVVRDVKGDDSLMSEEIFGPVLPVVPVDNVEEAIAFINSRDHPLVIYMMSQDSGFKSKVLDNTQSGAAVANEYILHCATENLPFGGLGPSGSGGYHTGKFGFDMFTHLRATLDSPSWIDLLLSNRYPPYSSKKLKGLQSTMNTKLPARNAFSGAAKSRWGRWLLFALAVAVSSAVLTRRGRLGLGLQQLK